MSLPRAGLLEDSDDARRALVLGLLQVHPLGQVRLGRGPADRNRTGVRGVAEQRAQDHHQLHAQFVGDAQQLVAERRQRIDGSMPRTRMTSRGLSPPTRPRPGRRPRDLAHSAVQPTMGRFTWKS